MPEDANDGSPKYMLCMPVSAIRAERDRSIGTPDGSIDVAQGDWAVLPHPGPAFVTSDTAFNAEFLPVHDGSGTTFVPRGRILQAALGRDGMMAIAGARITKSKPDVFHDRVARLSDDGRILCHASMPLAVQYQVMAKDATAKAHLAALRDLRDHLAKGLVLDPTLRVAIDAYDAASSGLKDSVSNGVAAMHMESPPNGIMLDRERGVATLKEGSILDTLVRDVGLAPQHIHEIRHTPTYQVEAYRAIGRKLLSPFIGEQPMETVLACLAPPGGTHPLEDWAKEGEMVEEADPIRLNEMPGYTTSYIRHYRRDGVDALCFEDNVASYAYAWPSPDVPSPRP